MTCHKLNHPQKVQCAKNLEVRSLSKPFAFPSSACPSSWSFDWHPLQPLELIQSFWQLTQLGLGRRPKILSLIMLKMYISSQNKLCNIRPKGTSTPSILRKQFSSSFFLRLWNFNTAIHSKKFRLKWIRSVTAQHHSFDAPIFMYVPHSVLLNLSPPHHIPPLSLAFHSQAPPLSLNGVRRDQ